MTLPWPVFAWKGEFFMAQKSRKHQTVTLPHPLSETAGYIRLSVTGKGGDDSIEKSEEAYRDMGTEKPASRIAMVH